MTAEGYAADQTGKREWRARVWWEGRWHTLGCRDSQADALKAARRVWHSLRGDWSGGGDATKREDFAGAFDKSAFQQEGVDEIIVGPHGDIRERNDWYVTRFRNLTPQRRAEIEAFLEARWYGSREIHNGQLFAAGADREFLLAMGDLIGALVKKPTKPTEGLAKVASGGRGNIGLNRNVFGGPVGQHGANRNAAINATHCAHCGRDIYGQRAKFCSVSCKQAAYRGRMAEVTP